MPNEDILPVDSVSTGRYYFNQKPPLKTSLDLEHVLTSLNSYILLSLRSGLPHLGGDTLEWQKIVSHLRWCLAIPLASSWGARCISPAMRIKKASNAWQIDLGWEWGKIPCRKSQPQTFPEKAFLSFECFGAMALEAWNHGRAASTHRCLSEMAIHNCGAD